MKRKIGKHISTNTTTILGLLVLTNAVAHADVSTPNHLNRCINLGMSRYGMTEQRAIAICQNAQFNCPEILREKLDRIEPYNDIRTRGQYMILKQEAKKDFQRCMNPFG